MASSNRRHVHYSGVIMSAMASQITGVSIVYSIVCSSPDQRKHQCSASLAVVRGIHRWSVNSPNKGLVTRKMFPFMTSSCMGKNRPVLNPTTRSKALTVCLVLECTASQRNTHFYNMASLFAFQFFFLYQSQHFTCKFTFINNHVC